MEGKGWCGVVCGLAAWLVALRLLGTLVEHTLHMYPSLPAVHRGGFGKTFNECFFHGEGTCIAAMEVLLCPPFRIIGCFVVFFCVHKSPLFCL